MPPSDPTSTTRTVAFANYINAILSSICPADLSNAQVKACLVNEVVNDVHRFLNENEQGRPEDEGESPEPSSDHDVDSFELGYEADDESGGRDGSDDECDGEEEEEEEEGFWDPDESYDWRDEYRGSMPAFHGSDDDYDTDGREDWLKVDYDFDDYNS